MTEIELMARTMWGEARGEGSDGMRAVAHVILNRLADRRWGSSIEAVIKQPFQFSVWNKNDPNRMKIQYITESNNKEFKQALDIARKVVGNELEDNTGGANHYHARAIRPRWADANKITARIGRHVFYKL